MGWRLRKISNYPCRPEIEHRGIGYVEKNEHTAFRKRFPGVRELHDMQRLAHRQIAGFDIYHHIMAAQRSAGRPQRKKEGDG
jgi:hypothetical protein